MGLVRADADISSANQLLQRISSFFLSSSPEAPNSQNWMELSGRFIFDIYHLLGKAGKT